MSVVLDTILKRFVRHGSLAVRYPDGTMRRYDSPSRDPGPRAGIWLKTAAAVRGMIAKVAHLVRVVE